VLLYDVAIIILLTLIALIIYQCTQNNRRIVKQIERCEAKLQECNEIAKQEFRRLTELENQLVIAEMLTPKDVLEELQRLRQRLHECREESAKEVAALRTTIATLAGHQQRRKGDTPPALPALTAIDYEAALQQLGSLLRGSASESDFCVYEQRLRDNLAETRKYGETPALKADRARIIDLLNEMALRVMGKRFGEHEK
jgi:hypothetical protein